MGQLGRIHDTCGGVEIGDDNRNDTRKENILEMDIMVKPSIGIS